LLESDRVKKDLRRYLESELGDERRDRSLAIVEEWRPGLGCTDYPALGNGIAPRTGAIPDCGRSEGQLQQEEKDDSRKDNTEDDAPDGAVARILC
jgi:hypothetical protein